MSNCNKICEKSIYSFPTNNLSTKMIQAQALKQKKNAKFVYKNTRIESIYKIILSLDYQENKRLLFLYKYKLYKRYFDDLQNVPYDIRLKLNEMLTVIINGLTEFEYNLIFEIVIITTVEVPETFIPYEYTFYVVTRVLSNMSYFIIKNINDTFTFEPGYSYVFDLSDPTNYGTKFALSKRKDGIGSGTHSGIPGTNGAILSINIEKNISVPYLYAFNEEIIINPPLDVSGNTADVIQVAYGIWGYSVLYLYINVGNLPLTSINNFIYKDLEQYSTLTVYELNGPKYLIAPLTDFFVYFTKNKYRYNISYGTYYIDIPRTYNAALLRNSGFEKIISFVGPYETTKRVKGVQFAPGIQEDISQNFYYGQTVMTVYEPFTVPLSFYCESFGFMGGLSFINFSPSGNSSGSKFPIYFNKDNNLFIKGIDSQSNLNIIKNGVNSYIGFNDDFVYNENRQYGLYKGVYTIYNIPEEYAITLLSKGKSDIIKLESLTSTSKTGVGPDNQTYNFYWGILRITVYANFGQMSLYSTYQGYMGRSTLFTYGSEYNNSISYLDQNSIPTIYFKNDNTLRYEDIDPLTVVITSNYIIYPLIPTLDFVVPFSVFKNTPPIINNINNNTTNPVINPVIPDNLLSIYGGYTYSIPNKNNKYSLKKGMYVIECENTYIGLLNFGKTNSITYFGIISIIDIGPDNHSYNYYANTIIISVLGNFGYISIDVIDVIDNNKRNRLHNILSYSN